MCPDNIYKRLKNNESMSHALGAIKFKDSTIRYYEYDGTSDVVISHHYETSQEVLNNWRNHKWINCECGNKEPVSIYTSYGFGCYIDGTACKKCNSVQSNDVDFDMIRHYETEDWAIKLTEFKNDTRDSKLDSVLKKLQGK